MKLLSLIYIFILTFISKHYNQILSVYFGKNVMENVKETRHKGCFWVNYDFLKAQKEKNQEKKQQKWEYFEYQRKAEWEWNIKRRSQWILDITRSAKSPSLHTYRRKFVFIDFRNSHSFQLLALRIGRKAGEKF